MTALTTILTIFFAVFVIVVAVPLFIFIRIWVRDENQEEHSVLRNYPLLGRIRYMTEKVGPELRQYLFNNDNEGKPFSRREFQSTYLSAKYKQRMVGFGSEREFDKARILHK